MRSRIEMIMALGVLTVVLAVSAAYAAGPDRLKVLEMRIGELEQQAAGGESGSSVHMHGYGELHYNVIDKLGKDDKMDFHRMVLGISYDFTESITLDVEVDFEHAATELELELAYVSFLVSDAVNFRVGSMLMPVGSLNANHEPTLFYSVERPYIQKYVVPTTWMEGGAGLFGNICDSVTYTAYAVGGLDAAGFSGSSGIRGGRGKVAASLANDLALVGRIDCAALPGLNIGASAYYGTADQDNDALDGVDVIITTADIRYRTGLLDLSASVANVDVSNTEELNALTEDVIGEQILGWNVEGACHLGRTFLPDEQDLVAFVRYEQFNTQEDVADGFEASPDNDRNVITAGVAYYPTEKLAFKCDIENWSNEAGDDWTQKNLALAFVY